MVVSLVVVVVKITLEAAAHHFGDRDALTPGGIVDAIVLGRVDPDVNARSGTIPLPDGRPAPGGFRLGHVHLQ